MGPASRSATLRPLSVRTLTAVPPPAPDPTTTTSNTWGVRVICSIHQPIALILYPLGLGRASGHLLHARHQAHCRLDEQGEDYGGADGEGGDRAKQGRQGHRTVERRGLAGQPVSDADGQEP